MESHKHLYEETFKHIATVLDVIAESQSKHEKAMVEIRKIQTEQARALAETRQVQAEQAKAARENEHSYARMIDAIERLSIRSAETDDKLNALIVLMDQHLREHRKN